MVRYQRHLLRRQIKLKKPRLFKNMTVLRVYSENWTIRCQIRVKRGRRAMIMMTLMMLEKKKTTFLP